MAGPYDHIFTKEFIEKLNFELKKSKFFEFYQKNENEIVKFNLLFEDFNFFELSKFSKLNLNRQEIKILVFDFFETLDKEIFCDIKTLLYDSNTRFYELENSTSNECSFVEVKLNRRVIFINYKDCLPYVLDVAHEFCHIASQRVKELKSSKCELLNEIEGKFIELLFCDFLVKNEIVSKVDEDNFFKFRVNDLKWNIEILNKQLEIYKCFKSIKIDKRSLKIVKENIAKKQKLDIKIQCSDIEKLAKNAQFCSVCFKNVIGILVSEVLFENFKTSPKETLEIFKLFLKKETYFTLNDGIKFLLGENYNQKINIAIKNLKRGVFCKKNNIKNENLQK